MKVKFASEERCYSGCGCHEVEKEQELSEFVYDHFDSMSNLNNMEKLRRALANLIGYVADRDNLSVEQFNEIFGYYSIELPYDSKLIKGGQ